MRSLLKLLGILLSGSFAFGLPPELTVTKISARHFFSPKPILEQTVDTSFAGGESEFPFVIRSQELNSEEELKFFLRHGFVSRLRLNTPPREAKRRESLIATDRELFGEALAYQKQGEGFFEADGKQEFVAPFVEASFDLGFSARYAWGLVSLVSERKLFGAVVAKIPSAYGVRTSMDRSFDPEGGFIFLGSVPLTRLAEFVVVTTTENQPTWSRYFWADGKLEKETTTEHEYKLLINRTLRTFQPKTHAGCRAEVLRWIGEGSWPAPPGN